MSEITISGELKRLISVTAYTVYSQI